MRLGSPGRKSVFGRIVESFLKAPGRVVKYVAEDERDLIDRYTIFATLNAQRLPARRGEVDFRAERHASVFVVLPAPPGDAAA